MTSSAVQPLRVYLDSSDYSTLSNPGCQTPELKSIRKDLLDWRDSGEVEFWFSSTAIVEMAPLDVAATPLAEARADLLVALCGRNALVSPDMLVREELQRAGQEGGEPVVAHSATGDWFGDVGKLIAPLDEHVALQALRDVCKRPGMSREFRRAAKRRLVKNGRPTNAALHFVGQLERAFDYSEILQMYPMKEEDMRVLGAYTLGRASIEEAEAALRESLRDPRWMTRWFAQRHEMLTPIIEGLRRPSRNLRASMKEVSTRYSSMAELKQAAGTGRAGEIPQDYWLRVQKELLVSTAGMLLDKMDALPAASDLRAEQLDAHSPGFSVCIRAMHNSLRDSVGKNAREPKASDFIDCIHALYVPYVDIFRADSYMSGHIAPLAAKHGTTVVQKLRNLPAEISRRLSSPRS